ncbi:MAG: DUF2244 domain-containing protein [Hyphomonadaceae bacterium]|nr:DUF2244 domain-containing protein [Hyphomonadaceae bacterium]
MSPNWERLRERPAEKGPLFFDAVLTPHRSLSRKAFVYVICGFAAVDVAVTTVFLLQGAYPVAFFLLLDVGLLWLAFELNYRAARAHERVAVAADRVLVSRHSGRGREAHWMVSPMWARVSADERSVAIASAGRQVRVGAFLSPLERGDFAKALTEALGRAKDYRPSTSRIE